MKDFIPSPELFIREINMQNKKNSTEGNLKIFFGYAAGVGKTYSMLKAAHQAQKEGIDVVVGYVEKHQRPETLALLKGIEIIPEKEYEYKGITLKEFDIDKALERNPQLILVDELAHTNVKGSRHKKRYQDIKELLRAGIDVYTTVNVQHIESLNDLVESITGIAVNERIPDYVFDSADKVVVVDIEPEELIERFKEGKVYKETQAQRALENFFTKENLAALREIALRRTADRLNRTAVNEGHENAVKAKEHILICISSSTSNERVIRTAARMAEAFHSKFTALFVETAESKELRGDDLKRLRKNLHLAEQLGAEITTVYGDDMALQIAEYAKISGVTKIVMGRTNHKTGVVFHKKTLADKLIECIGNIDIYIIPDNQPLYKPKKISFKKETFLFSWIDIGKMIIVLVITTLVCLIFAKYNVSEANIITVYILGVLITSVWTNGQIYGAISSLLGVLTFNFFFTEPKFTFNAIDPSYPITFFIMLMSSIISSSLAIKVKKQAKRSAKKAYYTEILLGTNKKLQKGRTDEEILNITAGQVSLLLNRPVLYCLSPKSNKIKFNIFDNSDKDVINDYTTLEEYGVAEWVFRNNEHAGASTNTLPNAKCLYLAVRGASGVLGIIGIPCDKYPLLDSFEKNLTIAIINECGIVLEKKHISDEKYAMETEAKQEKLRANLLRAISHDLRTPLTSISGNALMLMENNKYFDDNKKNEIYTGIYDDAMWLINLTENLLSITRIENGTMNINLQPELIEEVFQEALRHIDRNKVNHIIKVDIDDEFIMAYMDARLIIQVIINIVNNAIKYTFDGSVIILSAKRTGDTVSIKISDNGNGISDQSKEHLFDMFYTASQGKADSRRGLGLGLALCRSIILAHKGKIDVYDNIPNGTVFEFTLKLAEVNTDV